MFKYSLNIGALIGIALILLELISYLLGINNNNWIDTIGYVILALGLVYGIKHYRDTVLNGYLEYGAGVKLGLYLALAAAFLLSVYTYIQLNIDGSVIETALKEATDELYEDDSLTDEQLEMSLEMVKMFITPGVIAFFALVGQTILGLIFSLIISAFLKNPEPMFEEES